MGGLPFKRTAPRRPAGTPAQNDKPAEDDPLDMFQLRQDKVWFTEREKQAKDTAQKQEMKAMKKRLAEEDRQLENQLSRESSEYRSGSNEGKQRDSERRGSKRRHLSITSSGSDEPKLISSASRKPSRHDHESPNGTRNGSSKKSRPLTSRSSQPKQKSVLPPTAQVISLDDSSDDFTRTPTKSKGRGKATALSDNGLAVWAPADHERDDEDAIDPGNDVALPAEDDMGAIWVQKALERAKKRREAQEARENSDTPALDAPIVDIMIVSQLEGIPLLRVKIQIDKRITLIREAWNGKTKERLESLKSDIKPDVVDSMFLTWKGARIAEILTLERLGVPPPDHQGNLYPTSRSSQDGCQGWNKVLFEAWTEDLYKKFQDERARQRRRNLGEFDSEPDDVTDSQPEAPTVPKIKILLKSKNHEQQRYSVQPDYLVGNIVKTFRRCAKIPADKIVKIHFDGQVLQEDETIADLDLEDMDVLEVHVKDA